jgi:surface protein
MGNKLNNGYIGTSYLNAHSGNIGVVSGAKDYTIRQSDFPIDYSRIETGWTGPYVRPAEWVAMPDVTAGNSKFAGIFAVYNHDSNFVAFNFAGATYGVDWGDGTTSYIARGGTAYKQYTTSTYSGLTSQVFRGYKTLPIVVTTPSGGNFTSMNLLVTHNQPNLTPSNRRQYDNKWLEYKMSAPGFTGNPIPGTTNTWAIFNSMIERIEFVGSFASGFSSLQLSFNAHSALREIILPNTSTVVNMYGTFRNCTSLDRIADFDTSNVVTFEGLFEGCYMLKKCPRIDTRNGTNLSSLFLFCRNLEEVPPLDTRKATSMFGMFNGCRNLKTIPQLDTSNVTTMEQMFANCTGLVRVPLMDTQKVTSMNTMFSNCWSLVEVPLFDTKNVTTMSQMFTATQSLKSIPLFNTSKVTNMSFFLGSNSGYSSVIEEFPPLDTSNVTNMTYMFTYCHALRKIAPINTSKVTNFEGWLTGTLALRELPELDFSSATTLSQAFYNTGVVRFGNKVVSAPNATSADNLFRYNSWMTEVPMFNLPSCRSFAFMFGSCTNLNTIPGITFPTAASAASIGANAFQGMFQQCYNLKTLNVSPEFNILNASAGGANTTMYDNMFQECHSLGSVTGLTGFIYNLSLLGCKLSATGLNNIYRSLGTVGASGSGTRTITVTNNWGASAGLGHTPSLATSKGWTVVG